MAPMDLLKRIKDIDATMKDNEVREILDNHPTRVPSDDPKLYRWRNWKPNTPYAPVYDIPIYVDSVLFDGLDTLLDYKTNCSSKSKVNQGLWTEGNIFSWGTDNVKTLGRKLYDSYSDFQNAMGYEIIPKDKLWVVGWGLALMPGQSLKHHAHYFHENTYLSCNIQISHSETTTNYLLPYTGWYYGYWKVKNEPGKLCWFPSWAEHAVPKNHTKRVRYSLAFDMFTEHSINFAKENSDNKVVTNRTLDTAVTFADI
tara:strand:+ start:93 stop:860 length:768 start_codon:yes stop_codon:yes gene_type:complete